MTLDDAIAHARVQGLRLVRDCKTGACGLEHLQLARWLEELKAYRAAYPRPRMGGKSDREPGK